jgi:hypothetical protein
METKEIQFKLGALGKNKSLKKPNYGCLKNGKIPTFRQSRQNVSFEPKNDHGDKPDRPKGKVLTTKQYAEFGRNRRNGTVRVLVPGSKELAKLNKDKKNLEKHSLVDVIAYLTERNLYSAGSNAPEDVIREIYRSAIMAGDVNNTNPKMFLDNYAAPMKSTDLPIKLDVMDS